MISAKKILEGCLLSVANDCSEKWKMFLDGIEFTEDEEKRFPKDVYSPLDYSQHLVPLYKLAGYMCVNLRSGLSSASSTAKRKERSTVMDDFPGLPENASLFTASFVSKETWWADVVDKMRHTAVVIRDKKYVRIHSSDLVVGDIVYMSAGDIAGADVRVIVCTPGSLVDVAPISSVDHDYKDLQEKPSDIDPLYATDRRVMRRRSCNLVPAHCCVLDGMLFGIVVKTGSATLYSTGTRAKAGSAPTQTAVRLLRAFHRSWTSSSSPSSSRTASRSFASPARWASIRWTSM